METVLLLLLVSSYLPLNAGHGMVEVANDEEWVSCSQFKETISVANCLCHVSEEEGFKINCDNVVFPQDLPLLPFRQPITYFSYRNVNLQNLPPQGFVASGGIPLQTIDLSNNWLRRLPEKSLDGLTETLVILDLSHNLLGDQLNPIFTTNEFKRLPRLRALTLAHNSLSHLDTGILHNCLSLEEFYLDNNELKSVPSKSLKGPNSLKILDLSANKIDELSKDDFVEAASLLMLNASSNGIHSIEAGAFRGLSSLKILDMSNNKLSRLNSDALMGLATLEELDLSGNFLTQFPVNALKTVPTLKLLRVSSNLLSSLDPLKGLTYLEYLDLSRNRLSQLSKEFLESVPRLIELNLSFNQIRTIPVGIFENLKHLERLNLMDNNLLAFPAEAVESVPSLRQLNLDYNRISTITLGKTVNLTELSIARNVIRELPLDIFTKFPNLEYLSLEGNQMTSVEELQLPLNLYQLNLAHNNLRSIPRFQLPLLVILKLRGNNLSSLLEHNFVLLGNLRELDIRDNKISSFYSNTFDGMDVLLDLDLSGNLLEYIPKFGNFFELEILNFSRNGLKEIGTFENMENLKLLDLSHNELKNINQKMFDNVTSLFTIDLRQNKLNSFRGFESSLDRLKTLDLSSNSISYVYPNSFENLSGLWNLNLNDNRFSLFPTEFLKESKQLRFVGLRGNQLKNLNEMNFSHLSLLRTLDLSKNSIEFIPQDAFLNCTQLQYLGLSTNKLENLDPNMFHGILRLELDLSNNYLASLPATLFDRARVHKLQKINLNRNSIKVLPSEALQKQYFYLETLELAENRIRTIPPNLNVLVNVKTLDLSYNPLSENSLKVVLGEPKTIRYLNLANCSVQNIPPLEMPFLRSLNLSHNSLRGFAENVFERATLLEVLDVSSNDFYTLDTTFPGSLKYLDLSWNPLTHINGNHLPQSLESLKLNNLAEVIKVEKSALNLRNLEELELHGLPKLGYVDIRGIVTQLKGLKSMDFEIKDTQLVDQLHPALNSRVTKIILRGRRLRSISTAAFAGLSSPQVQLGLLNTSLSTIPALLVPLPMSTSLSMDVSGSPVTNLSPPFFRHNVQIQGFLPICDCNAINLVKYMQREGRSGIECSNPPNLQGTDLLQVSLDQLTCDKGLSTKPPAVPSTILTTTTTAAPDDNDIIWSTPRKHHRTTPKPPRKVHEVVTTGSKKASSASEVNNMDSLIFSIVGGVVGLLILFVIIIVCFVKITGRRSSDDQYPGQYPPPAPSVVSIPPHSIYGGTGGPGSKCTCSNGHGGGNKGHGGYILPGQGMYGTVRSQVGVMGPGSIYGVTMGPQSLTYMGGAGRHLQQQPMFTSMPYYLQDSSEYESRR